MPLSPSPGYHFCRSIKLPRACDPDISRAIGGVTQRAVTTVESDFLKGTRYEELACQCSVSRINHATCLPRDPYLPLRVLRSLQSFFLFFFLPHVTPGKLVRAESVPGTRDFPTATTLKLQNAPKRANRVPSCRLAPTIRVRV